MSYMHDFTMKTIKREKVDFIVPERIREACAFREYSYKEAAEKCDIDYKTFCAYASGHKEIPKEIILKLAGGLHFPKEFFYWVEWTRT